MPDQDRGERILDVRDRAEYLARHRVGAVNIPLEELAARIHELPPPDKPLTVFHSRPILARWTRSRLRARGRTNAHYATGDAWLDGGETASGPSGDRLWEPHALLARALGESDCLLNPGASTALDLACGSGRDAVYMALKGLRVEARDILPEALQMCRDTAERCGVTVQTRCCNLESDPDIREDAYDLIACFNFLHRPLMPVIARGIRRGGLVVYETFVHPQRERFGKPRRDAHLLKPGELPACFAGWEIVFSREGLTNPRRFAASLIARKR